MTYLGNTSFITMRVLCVAFIVVIFPQLVFAEFWITEVHYNPEGSDSGYEWVEIWNNSSGTESFEKFKLKENNVNHGIKEYSQDFVLSPFEYAVIADNAEKFMSVYPDYSGTLFDSAFSLSNSGEKLELVGSNGGTIFEVIYTNENGGDGNGQSVGLIDAIWQEVESSPGQANTAYTKTESTESIDEETEKSPSVANTQPTQVISELPATYIEIKNPTYSEKLIKIDAQGDRTVMAGVDYVFSGKVYGLQGTLIKEPVAHWNWGDGTKSDDVVSSHTYKYAGVYTATLSAHVSGYSNRDRVTVTVIEPSLVLGLKTDKEDQVLLTVHNTSNYTLEVSGYRISANEQVYQFPQESFVNAGQTIILDPEVLGFEIVSASQLILGDAKRNEISEVAVFETVLDYAVAQLKPDNIATQEVEGKTQEKVTHLQKLPGKLTHSVVYRQEQYVPEPVMFTEVGQIVESTEVKSFEQLQQAQINGAIDLNGNETSWWYILSLVGTSLLALGMYILTVRKERKRDSLSGVTLVD